MYLSYYYDFKKFNRKGKKKPTEKWREKEYWKREKEKEANK